MTKYNTKISTSLFLIGFILILFLQSISVVSYCKLNSELNLIEMEMDSETSEKALEEDVEWEDDKFHTNHNSVLLAFRSNSFYFLSSFFPPVSINSIEFPPEV